MKVSCITEMVNTTFEHDINRFICTRKKLTEKMKTETCLFCVGFVVGFFFNAALRRFTCFIYFSSSLQYAM